MVLESANWLLWKVSAMLFWGTSVYSIFDTDPSDSVVASMASFTRVEHWIYRIWCFGTVPCLHICSSACVCETMSNPSFWYFRGSNQNGLLSTWWSSMIDLLPLLEMYGNFLSGWHRLLLSGNHPGWAHIHTQNFLFFLYAGFGAAVNWRFWLVWMCALVLPSHVPLLGFLQLREILTRCLGVNEKPYIVVYLSNCFQSRFLHRVPGCGM